MGDGAGARDLGVNEAERRWDTALAKEPLAFADDDWEDEQAVLVDEAGVMQRVGQAAAPVDLKLSPRQGLEPGDFLLDVLADHRRALPGGIPQRSGHDVLGEGVESHRHGVLRVCDLCPVRLHHVVGSAPQQDGVGLGEPLRDDAAKVIMRDEPAPAFESATAVLFGPSRALHDPVEAEESVERELHGKSPSRW